MDAPAPLGKSEARRQTGRREKLTRLALDNSGSGFAQGFAHAMPVRRCVRCGVRVENLNLGGHDAPTAFRGPLWCLRCADGSPLQ